MRPSSMHDGLPVEHLRAVEDAGAGKREGHGEVSVPAAAAGDRRSLPQLRRIDAAMIGANHQDRCVDGVRERLGDALPDRRLASIGGFF